ncbi:MAG TPA: haloacid dehalogenase, partial [Candidatus Omnitrophota bacterium]|nr:haloacid dehalogenase [Candidatus Omnitrophota bacterium]
PDMRLRLDDIAVFRANWDNKADNIRTIAETLDIGLDSMVFVDDNPAERALVRRELPMVTVVELPEDPSHYVRAVHGARLFETLTFSAEDRKRADYYRANASRQEERKRFTDLAEYQRSLEMQATARAIDDFSLPRAAQLINKSNQFHLTGTRYSEGDIRVMLERPDWCGRVFTLKDRFGDNGLISVVLLHVAEGVGTIDTWVMSCRVLGRGMEEFIVNDLVAQARALGCHSLAARYVPSKKNKLVAGLYARMGFAAAAADAADGTTFWRLDLAQATPLTTQIAAA